MTDDGYTGARGRPVKGEVMDPVGPGALYTVAATALAGMVIAIINALTASAERKATAEERRTSAIERRTLLEQAQAAAHGVQVVKEMATTNTATILAVAKDTEAIKGHVNSEKTAGDGREATLRAENKLLRDLMADQQRVAALLAQAQILRGRGTDAMSAAEKEAVRVAEHTLRSIDANTAATVAAIESGKTPPPQEQKGTA